MFSPIKTPIRFVEAITLDILSLPGKFMSKENNAKWHLKYICPLCSKHRKKFRDPKRKGDFCLWQAAWEDNIFIFCKDFGVHNWIRYYLGLPTKLKKFIKQHKKLK